ncbi:hypothetical protein LTR49_024641 [Elasticomyces elasticus]|nr:hypothetical protein LTR49_024641 [Elasticomyces elasticus]
MSVAFLAGEQTEFDATYAFEAPRSTSHKQLSQSSETPRRPRSSFFSHSTPAPPAHSSYTLPLSSFPGSSESGIECHDAVGTGGTQPVSPVASSTSLLCRNFNRVYRKSLPRSPRRPRPAYTEEQKFFIVFCRIVKDLSWPEIEDRFARHFGLRTKDGLSSVYYRTRQAWGMEKVLEADSDGSVGDRGRVERKAALFSRSFLQSVGYFE